ncbi:MAG: hypothetical protein C4B58_14930 [Deltaproteobacteria bacterium]|nr:MAG: hypothetical protein C4B58_14930 [Deltaproteobacteria bacterium]
MADAWVHAVIDLIAYGRPYFDLHKEKDKPHEFLLSNHRIVNHKWYQAYKRLWNFHDPFPSWLKESIRILGNEEGADKAEEKMAWVDHDYIDRTWDVLSDQDRKYCEGFFAWVLFSPDILKHWAGVDVFKGRIQRVIKSREILESSPGLKSEYKRLYNYVKAVVRNNKILQNMLEHYGQEIKSIKGGSEL